MKENKNTYQSIDCGFYDEIEIAIMRGQKVHLTFENTDGVAVEENVLLKDTLTKDKAEFVILENGSEIRMDKIIQLNDKFASGESCSIDKAAD